MGIVWFGLLACCFFFFCCESRVFLRVFVSALCFVLLLFPLICLNLLLLLLLFFSFLVGFEVVGSS